MNETLKLNLGCGNHPLDGFVNLDKKTGWLWENGLKAYPDGTVDAITVSHTLMYVRVENWPFIFSELYRVLKQGGVLRITEDETEDPKSRWYGGHPEAVSLTSPAINRRFMERAGFTVFDVTPDESKFSDTSLIQQWHNEVTVFFIEGVKC